MLFFFIIAFFRGISFINYIINYFTHSFISTFILKTQYSLTYSITLQHSITYHLIFANQADAITRLILTLFSLATESGTFSVTTLLASSP